MFILLAVEHELEQRRKEELRRSLRVPHPESERVARAGTVEWVDGLPEGDTELVDIEAGESVLWIPDKGWKEEE